MKSIGQPELDTISLVYGDLGTRVHNCRDHLIIQANCYLSWSIHMYNIPGIFTLLFKDKRSPGGIDSYLKFLTENSVFV